MIHFLKNLIGRPAREPSQIHRADGHGKSRRRRVFEVLLRGAISTGLIAGSVGLFLALGKGGPPETRSEVEAARPVVEVVAVVEHKDGIDFDVDGVVVPFRQVEVPAEVPGRVSFRAENCRVGHMVAKGELLMRIDPQDYELEVRRVTEDLKQAKANLHELEVETAARGRQIELAREDLVIKQREVRRYESIDDPGVYSKSELDSARLKELQARDAVQTELDQLELLKARRERLESARDLATAQLDKAGLDLARTDIRSPIAGVITQEPVEQDTYVGQRGGTVAVVQDTSCMEIQCSLHMHQIQWIWQSPRPDDAPAASNNAYQIPETPVTVRFHTGTTCYTWQGSLVGFDGAQVDKQTRMVPCRVYVRNLAAVRIDGPAIGETAPSTPITLLAGMFVMVRVHARPAFSLLRLPEAAVQPGNEVWMVRPADRGTSSEGRLQKRPIRIAHASKDAVLVYADGSNVREGDPVVISPLATPTENAPVEILEPK